MDEVAQVDGRLLGVGGAASDWHVQRALTQERLAVGRHVTQIVHHHKHLDHSLVGVEQCL